MPMEAKKKKKEDTASGIIFAEAFHKFFKVLCNEDDKNLQ